MQRNLGRVGISRVLITIYIYIYWPLLNMYSENFGFGPGGFYY